MTESGADTQGEHSEESPSGPARELTLHLLRMLETRADAASIAVQSEIQSFSSRLQLRVLAGAAIFFAIWAGIVLLAIVLPPQLRVPVLAVLVGLFVAGGVIALVVANRKVDSHEVGSMTWVLDSLKLDLEVFSRALDKHRATAPHPQPPSPPPAEERNTDELAA
jgi:uncharacterized membrane protein YqjE